MPSTRIVTLLLLLLAVQGQCKPTKSSEIEDYNGDADYASEDYPGSEDDAENDTENDNDGEPQILSQPVSLRKRVGETAVLPCAVNNTAKYAVVWQKGNEYLYSDNSVFTQEPKRIVRFPNNTLIIYNLTLQDASNNYTCGITTEPRKSIVHQLHVEPLASQSPVRVTPSERVHVRQGENITLGCHTNLEPIPTIKWFRESERLYNDKVIINGNFITIHRITRHEGGRYQCLADNGLQNPPHAVIEVIVEYAPEIEAEMDVVHTGIDVESNVTCIVHAHPRAKVTWYKDKKEVLAKKTKIMLKEHKNRHILKIVRTTADDFGHYTCMAMNAMGQASKTISLTGTPSRPRISGGEIMKDDTELTLKWIVDSYSEITEYKLKYRRKGDEEWVTLEPPVTKENNMVDVKFPLTRLQPGSYEVILSSKNRYGWSPSSEPHIIEGDYVSEPQNVKGSAVVIRPFAAIIALLLVVSTRAFPSP